MQVMMTIGTRSQTDLACTLKVETLSNAGGYGLHSEVLCFATVRSNHTTLQRLLARDFKRYCMI